MVFKTRRKSKVITGTFYLLDIVLLYCEYISTVATGTLVAGMFTMVRAQYLTFNTPRVIL